MKAVIFTAILLFLDAPINSEEVMEVGTNAPINAEEVMEVAPNVRSLMLGIFIIYDNEVVKKSTKAGVTFNPHEYFNQMVEMAQRVHFANITCTNVSLVYMGSQQLNDSSGVEVEDDVFVEVDATLLNLRDYSFQHRSEFGNPDLTVLATGKPTKKKTSYCWTAPIERTGEPKLRSTCKNHEGGTYYKGMCGNDSVAIIEDEGTKLNGATSLALQITTLMGTDSDIYRTEEKYSDPSLYFTSSAWRNSYGLKNIGLSEPAQMELSAYMESMSNSSNNCWRDIPIPKDPGLTMSLNVPFVQVDQCKWRKNGYYRCNKTLGGNECNLKCCKTSENCPEEKKSTFECEEETKLNIPHNGKPCGSDGVCYEYKCLKK